MVTLIKYGALSGGEKYNVNVLSIDGLSTDTKPTVTYIEYGSDGREVGRMGIPNGSIFTEIDTGDTYMYDAENTTWYKVSIGGGGTQGGIVLVGETTTALTDGATTNPITVDGQSYTAQANDAVIYLNKEFLFDGTKWHEFGDLSGLASKDIGAMTGYTKASTAAAIATTDTLNQAVGKLEKGLDGKQDALTFDSAPTQNSTNPVTSGGVYTALTNKQDTTLTGYTAESPAKSDTITANDTVIQAVKKLDERSRSDENDILTLQGKVKAHSEGGTDYDVINGIRVYVSATAPTGDIPTGSLWIGG